MAKIDNFFQDLIKNKGSDLHLEQGQKPKIRLHGELQELGDYPVLAQNFLTDVLKEIVDAQEWAEFENNGDLDFAYALGQQARLRANYFRHFYGLGAVFRLIPSEICTLDQLAMPETLRNFANLRSGLVLITGPTGSGKSTTLAAVIDHINKTKIKKIVTIEEPVEFIHPKKESMITHREVGLDTASFANGLRSAIKSDVNIILVGEMRDRETIELALTAAEMGILVFGTLHTNSAAKTIDRVIDVFPANKKNQIRTVLANNLKAVVAQQLLKRTDGKGRVVAYEILTEAPSIAPIILSGKTVKLTSEIQMNKKSGMILMDDCLTQLVNSGVVTREAAYMKALDKNRFMAES